MLSIVNDIFKSFCMRYMIKKQAKITENIIQVNTRKRSELLFFPLVFSQIVNMCSVYLKFIIIVNS